MKKIYRKPVLNSRAVALGVFGDYGNTIPDGKGGDGDSVLQPFKPITDSDLHRS